MTDRYFLDVFRRMCDEGTVIWYLNDQEGGYVAEVNERIFSIIGSDMSWIMLTVTRGFKQYVICEPKPHLSETAEGRFISFLKKQIGLPAVKGPETSDDQDKSAVRAHLNAILKIARAQHKKRCDSGIYPSEQFKKELLDAVIFQK